MEWGMKVFGKLKPSVSPEVNLDVKTFILWVELALSRASLPHCVLLTDLLERRQTAHAQR